jgi:putative hemolysin
MTSSAKVTDLSGTHSLMDGRIYERGALSYASSFESPFQRLIVHGLEWLTAKPKILRIVRAFERSGPHDAEHFFSAALDALGVTVTTPADQIAHIPANGPVIFLANHPHGMVDGMVIADMVARRRPDFRVLARSLLMGIDTVASEHLISVPFPQHPDAQRQMVQMRSATMAQLSQGGLVALFPSGGVAASKTLFGPPIEGEWSIFTAKMIRQSGATVVPCHFLGRNSRAYYMANRMSATLRQGMLLHEIARATGSSVGPVIGQPIPPHQLKAREDDPRALMAWLRDKTLKLST